MLAITSSPLPAASMSSPSIFSVAVERMPFAPRAASRSSSRPGGRSKSTLTSKPSSSLSPASGISRVTSTFSATSSLPPLGTLLEELAQYRLEDAAVPQVLDLDRRVDAGLDPELLRGVVLAGGPDYQLRTGREVAETLDVVGLLTI